MMSKRSHEAVDKLAAHNARLTGRSKQRTEPSTALSQQYTGNTLTKISFEGVLSKRRPLE